MRPAVRVVLDVARNTGSTRRACCEYNLEEVLSGVLICAAHLAVASAPAFTPDPPKPKPVTKAQTPRLSLRLSIGGLMGSAWYVPSFRSKIEVIRGQGPDSFFARNEAAPVLLIRTAPVLGPWLMAIEPRYQADLPALLLTGIFQVVGLGALAQVALDKSTPVPGPELSFSPLCAGHLGLSASITGW